MYEYYIVIYIIMYFGSAVRPLQKFPQSLLDVQDQISSQSSKNERLVSDYSYVMSEQFPCLCLGELAEINSWI